MSEVVRESLVTTKEVAELLGCAPETVRRMFVRDRPRGDEPSPIRLSGGYRSRLRWRLSDVEAWIKSQAESAPRKEPPSEAPGGFDYSRKLW